MARNSRNCRFPFDDYPAFIDAGFECGSLSGYADITYWPDGEWSIDAIALDGVKQHVIQGKKGRTLKTVWLDAGTPLHSIIFSLLEDEKRDDVQEAIRVALEEDRAAEADAYADIRRDRLMMEARP